MQWWGTQLQMHFHAINPHLSLWLYDDDDDADDADDDADDDDGDDDGGGDIEGGQSVDIVGCCRGGERSIGKSSSH